MIKISDIVNALSGIMFLSKWYAQDSSKRDSRLWTFGAWDGMRYSDNSRALYEYVLLNCPQIKAVWMTKSDTVYQRLHDANMPVVKCGSSEAHHIQQQAGYFFLTKGPEDSEPRYMHGCNLIWLWHGMPLKQIGRDAMAFQRKNTLFKRFKTRIRKVTVPWEFLDGPTLSTSGFFIPFLQSAFALQGSNVWNVGLPRNDNFFKTDFVEDIIGNLHRKFDRPSQPVRLVLYMPTHRDKSTREGHPFNPFDEAGFDVAALDEILEKGNYILLYKGHFFDSSNNGVNSSSRIITVSDQSYDDMYTFIKDVDILITDYSSIYFDFLLCNKPVILFPFDEEDYVHNSRPFYFDYSLLEGAHVYSWKELCQCLAEETYYVPSQKTKHLFNDYCDGNSCKRIVEMITENIIK